MVLSRKMIEAFLRYIYEPRKRRKKKEMHRAMNSPLEPTFFFFFNRPSIAKDEAHALHGIPAQAAGASSVCSNERRGGDAEEEEEEDETRAEVVLIDARSLTSLAIQIHAGVLHRCR